MRTCDKLTSGSVLKNVFRENGGIWLYIGTATKAAANYKVL